MGKVTVVIPLYNKEKYVRSAVQSVFNQTFTDWKLLIIDDGSQDRSFEQIKDLSHYPNVQCISMKKNIGTNNILNYALTLLTTPFFVQLDPDDWLAPTALEKQYKQAQANKQIALVYGNHITYWENSEGQVQEQQLITLEQYKDKYDFLAKINYAVVPRFYRTSAVKEIGGWLVQSEGDMLAEDVQMPLRLAARYQWVWINEVLYHRRRYAENYQRFQKTRPIARQYRYELYNQLLKEWGDEYSAQWRVIGDTYYFQGLIQNQRKRDDEQWNIPL